MPRSPRLAVLALLLLLPSCRCGTALDTLGEISASPTPLVFEPTFVGAQRAAQVQVLNTGGERAALEVSTAAPFTVDRPALSLPGRDALPLTVTFTPTSPGPAEGTLLVGALEVPLRAEGLAAQQCIATSACSTGQFDPAAGVCRVTTLPEGSACESRCVVGGACQGDVCRGQLRACDDGEACTTDACSEADGCVHLPRECAAPASPCQSARCVSGEGCVVEEAPDGTLCGPDDCKATTVKVCIAAQCVPRIRPGSARCANRWVPLTLFGRAFHAMAYDASRARVVLFGGSFGSFAGQLVDDTWEWDGTSWTLRIPAASPTRRVFHAMAYDAARRRVVLFGGEVAGAPVDDTWEFDGQTWVLRHPAAAPTPRLLHAMAWDPLRQRVVLVGGSTASGPSSETWEWDGANWAQRTPTAALPARQRHAMAWDVARQRLVLFGGVGASGALADTWEWDGTAWAQRTTAAAPPAQAGAVMAYDAARARVVLLGGLGSAGDGVWEWNGLTWTQRLQPGAPAPTEGQALAYDAARGRLLLSVGFDPATRSRTGDTWSSDGTAWSLATPATPPVRIDGVALAEDRPRQKLLLFGGGALADTWEFNGTSWAQRSTPTHPPARDFPALSWDSANSRAVLFGGDGVNDTWLWDSVGWSRVSGLAPPAGGGFAMAYDEVGHRTVLVALGATWLFNGALWSSLGTFSLPTTEGRIFSAMAFDEARGRMVLFGGQARSGPILGDTHEWQGVWGRAFPAQSPSARFGHGMAYDRGRQKVVLLGGISNVGALNDTWEWDGTSWTQLTPGAPPVPGSYAMVYDTARSRLVAFGAGTWLYLP